jgi:hypothetical protein
MEEPAMKELATKKLAGVQHWRHTPARFRPDITGRLNACARCFG